ncbi:MAG: RDD family protein [Pseudomonadota bacterium]
MRSLFLASLPQRIALSAFISLVLVLGWLGLLMLSTVDGWREAGQRFDKWNAGQGARCESLFAQVGAELEAIAKGRCMHLSIIDPAYKACDAAEDRRKNKLIDSLYTSDCPTSRGSWNVPIIRDSLGMPAPELAAPPARPGSLLEYSLDSRGLKIPAVPAGFVGLATLLLVLWDASCRLVVEGHAGWRRLMLVMSALTAAAVIGYYLWDGEDLQETLTIALLAFFAALLVLIYGRWIYLWVVAGFQGSKEAPQPMLTPATEPKVAPEVLALPPQAASEPPDEAPVKLAAEEPTTHFPLATYWPRFWSRCIDLPIGWVIGSIFAAFLPDSRSLLPGMPGIILDLTLSMAVICLVIFAYEAFFVGQFGATPGKMLFGLSVQSTDNRMPTGNEARRRAWGYLKSGLYFTLFLPILQIFGAASAWKKRDGSQPWDMTARTFVRQAPISPVRFGIATMFAFCFITAMLGSHMVLKEITKKEVRESVLR